VTGLVEHPAWAAPAWHDLTRVGTGTAVYFTRFKTVYSPKRER